MKLDFICILHNKYIYKHNSHLFPYEKFALSGILMVEENLSCMWEARF